MRGLRKYLTPFAPDQSGAVSVLFELGGIVVIWKTQRSYNDQQAWSEETAKNHISGSITIDTEQ